MAQKFMVIGSTALKPYQEPEVAVAEAKVYPLNAYNRIPNESNLFSRDLSVSDVFDKTEGFQMFDTFKEKASAAAATSAGIIIFFIVSFITCF